MASGFINKVGKFLSTNTTPIDSILLRVKISFMIVPHIFYVLSTSSTKEIIVTDKYLFTCNGFTKFMIIDTNNKHYCVNNSLWYWKWDSIEDWSSINKNNKIFVKYYGYRIPFLAVFPNIYFTKKTNVSLKEEQLMM
jgi:hypothetical protein